MSIESFGSTENLALNLHDVVNITAIDCRSRKEVNARIELIGFEPNKGWPIVLVILDNNETGPVTKPLPRTESGKVIVTDNQGKQIELSYSFNPKNYYQLNIEGKPADSKSEPLEFAEA